MTSRYKDPQKYLSDIIHGHIDLAVVPMNEYIQLTTMHMVSQQQTHMSVDIPYGGGVYLHHHYIEAIRPPASGINILEQAH